MAGSSVHQEEITSDARRRRTSAVRGRWTGSWLASGALLMLGLAAHGDASAASGGFVERYWPIIASVGGSFIAGFLIGKLARRTMKTAAIVAGIALLVIFVLGRFGVDGSVAEQYISASSDWLDANIEGAGRYAASLLPSATAAAVGGFLGFRRNGVRPG